jgi:hypothetical protein
VDGRLGEAGRRTLLEHTRGCADCAAALAAARRLDGVLAAEALAEPSETFEQKLLFRIAAGVTFARGADAAARRGGAGRAARDPLREPADGDPMTPLDWALLGGMIAFTIAAVAGALVLVLPGSGGAPPAADGSALGAGRVLSFAAQAPAAAFEQISRWFLRQPLTAPLLLASGLLAVTLGWIRLFLARNAS